MLTKIITTIMIIDVLGFMMWTLSNQSPVDGFYVGAITSNIIKMII
jgi:hypothetical protein